MKTMRENGINQILGELMNITIENIGNFVTEDEIWNMILKVKLRKKILWINLKYYTRRSCVYNKNTN